MNKYFKKFGGALFLSSLIVSVAPAQVVITELMYHPASDADGDEYIEIHNPTGSPVVLTGWCFEGVELCFDPGDEIAPNEYLVLGPEGGQTFDTYGVTPFRTYTLSVLDDNGERIALLNGSTVVDEVTFDDGPPDRKSTRLNSSH